MPGHADGPAQADAPKAAGAAAAVQAWANSAEDAAGPAAPARAASAWSRAGEKVGAAVKFKRKAARKNDVSLLDYMQFTLQTSSDLNDSDPDPSYWRRFLYWYNTTPLSPNAPWRVVWDMLIKLLVVEMAFLLPLQLSEVVAGDEEQGLSVFETLADFVFLADVFLNLRTALVDKNGEFVTDLREIRRHYVRGWFAIDLISAVPVELLIGYQYDDSAAASKNANLLKVLKLPRLFRVHRLVGNLRFFTLQKMLTVLGVMLLTVHWFACAWNIVAINDSDSTVHTWLAETPNMPRYLVLLHHTWIMLLKNDVHPLTLADGILFEVGIVGGILLEASVFATLVLYVQKIGAKASDFVTRVEFIRDSMTDLQLPASMQTKVLNYYDYLWTRFNGNVDRGDWMKELSLSLQSEINEHLHLAFLRRIPIFKRCEDAILRELTHVVTPRIYQPKDIVVRKGDYGSELFFVQRGALAIFFDRPGHNNDVGSNGDDGMMDEHVRSTADGINDTINQAKKSGGVSLREVNRIKAHARKSVHQGHALKRITSYLNHSKKRRKSLTMENARLEMAEEAENTVAQLIKLVAAGDGSERGETVPAKVISAGAFFGEVSVLLRERRIATVQSLTYCDLYTLHTDAFHSIMRKYPNDLFVIRWLASKRLNEVNAEANREVRTESAITNMDNVDDMITLATQLCSLLSNCPIFKETDASRDFIESISTRMERQTWEPDAPVLQKGSASRGLYLIQQGEAMVVDELGNQSATLNVGSSFGEQGLVENGIAMATVKACPQPPARSQRLSLFYEPLVTFFLSRESLEDIVTSFPEEYMRIRDYAAKKKEEYRKVEIAKRTIAIMRSAVSSDGGSPSSGLKGAAYQSFLVNKYAKLWSARGRSSDGSEEGNTPVVTRSFRRALAPVHEDTFVDLTGGSLEVAAPSPDRSVCQSDDDDGALVHPEAPAPPL